MINISSFHESDMESYGFADVEGISVKVYKARGGDWEISRPIEIDPSLLAFAQMQTLKDVFKEHILHHEIEYEEGEVEHIFYMDDKTMQTLAGETYKILGESQNANN